LFFTKFLQTVLTSLVPGEPFFVSETESGSYRVSLVKSCRPNIWTFEISSRSLPAGNACQNLITTAVSVSCAWCPRLARNLMD